MCNTLKQTIERLDYSQKSVSHITGISEARLSNLCRMPQDRFNTSIKHHEMKSLDRLTDGLYWCFTCEGFIDLEGVGCYQEREMGHLYFEESYCMKCGSVEFFEVDLTCEDFYVP